MIRRAFLAIAALALFAPPALAAEGDPVSLVRELYRLHGETEKTKVSVFKPPLRDRFFSRTLARLLAADDKRPEARLTYDPIYNAQDFEISGLVVTLKSRRGMTSVVEARFRNFGRPTRLEYDLVYERGAWRIADIRANGMQPDGRLTHNLRRP
jgi:hypothetical protein